MVDFVFANEKQKESFEGAVSEIKSMLTFPAEFFVSAEILNGREVSTDTIPFRVFVSAVDFVDVCEIAEKYEGTLSPFSVTKKENKTEERGVYFVP